MPDVRNEAAKLIELAYNLQIGAEFFRRNKIYEQPPFIPWDGFIIINNGKATIKGSRKLEDHDQNQPCTNLEIHSNKYDFRLVTWYKENKDNKEMDFTCSVIISDSKNKCYQTFSKDKELDLFAKAMEIIGFKKEDILSLLNGRKKAKEVFEAVAPPEIIDRHEVYLNRRGFSFKGNIMVAGQLGGIELGKFPFPFEDTAVIDCATVETQSVIFDKNNKHKLINVNKNRNSIKFVDLRNAIIEEEIDLSKVDATYVKFGQQTLINLDKAITPLNEIYDLSLAVDKNGNHFKTDKYGAAELENGKLKTITLKEKKPSIIKVLANADSGETAMAAIKNGAEGIGLVRTEHMFYDKNKTPIFISLFIEDYFDNTRERNEILRACERIQNEKVDDLLKAAGGKRIIFRLIDAKLNEYLNLEQLNEYKRVNWINSEEELRGAAQLYKQEKVLIMQAKSILSAANNHNAHVDLLIPMVTDVDHFDYIQKIIKNIAKRNGFKNYRVGAMIETVAMASDADILARNADFISFGTNDLTESVTGQKRNINVKAFSVLTDETKDIIRKGIHRARITKPNIEIGFCGDHSSNPNNLDFYKEVGADYISCKEYFVPVAKTIFKKMEKEESGTANNNMKIEQGKSK